MIWVRNCPKPGRGLVLWTFPAVSGLVSDDIAGGLSLPALSQGRYRRKERWEVGRCEGELGPGPRPLESRARGGGWWLCRSLEASCVCQAPEFELWETLKGIYLSYLTDVAGSEILCIFKVPNWPMAKMYPSCRTEDIERPPARKTKYCVFFPLLRTRGHSKQNTVLP